MTTGKNVALTTWTFVGKVMSLLFNMLSRLVIVFLPRSKRLLISWLQSPSAVVLEPPQNKEILKILKIIDSVYIKVQGEEGTVKWEKGGCHVWAPAVCQVLNATSSPCACLCRRCIIDTIKKTLLSKVNQRQKDKCHMISPICVIEKKGYRWTYLLPRR